MVHTDSTFATYELTRTMRFLDFDRHRSQFHRFLQAVCFWYLVPFHPHGLLLQVGRVHSRLHKVVRGELLTHQSLGAQAASKRIPHRYTGWLARLLERMLALRPGQYLMTHALGAESVSFYESTAKAPMVGITPLPAASFLHLLHFPRIYFLGFRV